MWKDLTQEEFSLQIEAIGFRVEGLHSQIKTNKWKLESLEMLLLTTPKTF